MNVLNRTGRLDSERSGQSADSSLSLSQHIQRLIRRIKSEFMMEGNIDYMSLRHSELYDTFVQQTNSLCTVDLDLFDEDQRKCLFINVYNTLTIHGVLQQETMPASVLTVDQFWKNTAYEVGGHIFTLDDMEHGILRANSPHPARTEPQFKAGDPRIKYALKRLDPRIHFALNCGAKSCPIISIYGEDNLDRCLDDAARSFCSQEVTISPDSNTVMLSKLFMWYSKDFGETDLDLLRWIHPYLGQEPRSLLDSLLGKTEVEGRLSITYANYNWALNVSSSSS